MKRFVRFVCRRWILSLVAAIILIGAANYGWRAWRREALQQALEMKVERVWITMKGNVNIDSHCRFNPNRLPWWHKLVCPKMIKIDHGWDFSLHPDFNPRLSSYYPQPNTFPEPIPSEATIECGVWYPAFYRSDSIVSEEARKKGTLITVEVDARLSCFFPSSGMTHDDWEKSFDQWMDRFDKLRWLPRWLEKLLFNAIVPFPQKFKSQQQTFTIDPFRRDFDFVTQTPIQTTSKP